MHLEGRRRRVEQVDGEGGEHAGEEDHPAELHAPEGRHLLHGKEQATDRSPEGGRHPSRHASRREVPPASNEPILKACIVDYSK